MAMNERIALAPRDDCFEQFVSIAEANLGLFDRHGFGDSAAEAIVERAVKMVGELGTDARDIAQRQAMPAKPMTKMFNQLRFHRRGLPVLLPSSHPAHHG